MNRMTIDDAIFEFELMASDKCNGKNIDKYKQISEWLKELKMLKERNNDGQWIIIARQIAKNKTSHK